MAENIENNGCSLYPESVYRYFCGNDHYLVLTDL